jgi:hypothetical protein
MEAGMKKHLRHGTTVILLGSYVALGVVGHLEVLRLLGFGTALQYLTRTKPGPPPTAKVYWTQYKHIPSSVRIAVPSPAVIARPEVIHRLQFHGIALPSGFLCSPSGPIVSLQTTRAPPQT